MLPDTFKYIISYNNNNNENILKKQKLNNNDKVVSGEIDITNLPNQTFAQEWLFWKVFRNKFVYKKIMSNMDTHLSTPYHSIISVSNMIKYNQLNILRDKVIRNQHLSLVCQFNKIFGVIRNDDDQDRLFYQQLFKHYGQYSLGFNNVTVERSILIDIENGREKLVNEIIKSNCIPALQVLIQHYQYIPTNSNLHNAMFFKRFKLVKLLTASAESQLKVSIKGEELIYDLKILDHFYANKLISKELIDRKLKLILDKLDIEECTLKSLIGTSQIILKCNNQTNSGCDITIEEIESFYHSLTKQELKSILSDKSNQIKSKKKMIKKLLQLCYTFSSNKTSIFGLFVSIIKIQKPQFYYIYFCSGEEIVSESDIGKLQSKEEAFLSFLRFGDLNFLSSFNITPNSSYFMVANHFKSSFKSKEPDFLFSHCPDKEKQMKFLKEIINLNQKQLGILDPIFLFHLLLYNDDLDQIKYVVKEMDIRNILTRNYQNNALFIISNYIRSTLVLEWLFLNGFIDSFDDISIWYFKSVELLQHYEKLYKKFKSDSTIDEISLIPISTKLYKNQNSPSVDIRIKSQNLPLLDIKILEHILKSGSTIYKFKQGSENLFWFIINHFSCSENDKFELLKLVYFNFGNGNMDQLIGYLNSKQLYEYNYEICIIKFINWFCKKFNNNEYSFIFPEHYIIDLFLFNKDLFNKQNVDLFIYNFIKFGSNETNIQHLDFILKSTYCSNYRNIIKNLITGVVSFGKLNTLKYIHQNYNWLLKNSNSNPNGIFTTEELNEFLFCSLANNQLVISDYLFDLLFSISKKQFNDKAGDISKLYYRNKFFK